MSIDSAFIQLLSPKDEGTFIDCWLDGMLQYFCARSLAPVVVAHLVASNSDAGRVG